MVGVPASTLFAVIADNLPAELLVKVSLYRLDYVCTMKNGGAPKMEGDDVQGLKFSNSFCSYLKG